MANSQGRKLVLEDQGLDDLDDVARQIRQLAGDCTVWLLSGDLGVGKTTLLKSIARIFSIRDAVSSPTFGLVNEYRDRNDNPFYHFDFYRIEDIREVVDIGFDEYLDSGAYCFIEWPEKIEALLPDQFVLIRIKEQSPELRRFEIDLYE
jgi:tRNA threonylcarbamoyladenosine biosynthesis protein TsaE